MDQFSLLVLVFGPAVVGVVALIAGILLLVNSGGERNNEEKRSSSLALRIFAGCCLLVAFGIGACYATLLVG